MCEDKKENKMDGKEMHTSNLDYILCPIHNVRYPKGGNCRECEKDKDKE